MTATADLKGKIVEHLWYMNKQGDAEATVQTHTKILETPVKLKANLNEPESVKLVIAKHNCSAN
jgi:hypothetical protein